MGNIIYTFPESRTSNGLLQWSNSHLFGPVVILKCFDTAVKFFTASFIKNLIWWVFFVHMNQPTNKWNLETKSDFMLGSNIRISPTLQANNKWKSPCFITMFLWLWNDPAPYLYLYFYTCISSSCLTTNNWKQCWKQRFLNNKQAPGGLHRALLLTGCKGT